MTLSASLFDIIENNFVMREYSSSQPESRERSGGQVSRIYAKRRGISHLKESRERVMMLRRCLTVIEVLEFPLAFGDGSPEADETTARDFPILLFTLRRVLYKDSAWESESFETPSKVSLHKASDST